MDWRLQAGLERWLIGSGVIEKGFDRVSVAGAVKGLNSFDIPSAKEFILNWNNFQNCKWKNILLYWWNKLVSGKLP